MKNTLKKIIAILGITGISIVSFAVPPTNIRKPKTNISQPKKKLPPKKKSSSKDDKRIKNFIKQHPVKKDEPQRRRKKQ